MTRIADTADLTVRPLVMQLRDALRNAEAELQRRCFISLEIKQALAAANVFLDGRVEENRHLELIPKSSAYE